MAERPKIVSLIIELRKSIRNLALSTGLATLAIFVLSPHLLQFVQHHLDTKLYFFSVAGPFLAHVTLSFFAALLVLMPWLTIVIWRAMGRVFRVPGKQVLFFVMCTCLFFYGGIAFCYFITLPFGITFLLGFSSEELRPVISVNQFVTFIALFILAFGIIFQLPIVMVFFARIGLLGRRFYEKNRRYAVLVMAIASAILTPTPDIVNMALMGGPLYLLYETGIIILRLFGIGEGGVVGKPSELDQG
jgi:sec-independent protein translocase protein TatC